MAYCQSQRELEAKIETGAAGLKQSQTVAGLSREHVIACCSEHRTLADWKCHRKSQPEQSRGLDI